ncbi:hypothetical protein C2845_PM07G08960 [Panicum miliaceum]|uniref:Uncharacterized protein n=1 Tax=Panicum miliaceum TaxID=4540 RepID=A0A3L6SV69_PANMI|nr:hypothetical protein C2845_PM07G08960 [Panicum miliaceum]
MDATQEFVAALTTDPDADGVEIVEAKEEAWQLRREKEILEAHLHGAPEPRPLGTRGEEADHWANSPLRKHVRYGDPDYRTRYL